MSRFERVVLFLYRLLLFGYPAEFQDEFGAEMQAVFEASLLETNYGNTDQRLWRLLWREIRDWPDAVVREHLRVRRKKMSINGYVDAKPLSRRELLTALFIFLFPLLFYIIVSIPNFPKWLGAILLVAIFVSVISAFVFAVIKGFPRWSFSYLGFLLFMGLYFGGPVWFVWGVISPFINDLFGPRGTHSELDNVFVQGFMELEIWFMVLMTGIILITLLRMLPPTRGIWLRVRSDWTQLSFLVYGGVILYIVFIFDEYHYKEPWIIGAFVFMTLGGWLYLRAGKKGHRILALISGATLALGTVAIGKWFLVPLQTWGENWRTEPLTPSVFESGWAIISGVAIIGAMLAPALLGLMPSKAHHSAQEENGSV